MATKEEMEAELAELGRDVEAEDYSWDELAEMLREARSEGQESPESGPGVAGAEEVSEAPRGSEGTEKRYSIGQLKRYSRMVLGVDSSLVVGAQSAGMVGSDEELMTIAEAAAAVGRYERGE